MNLAEFPIAILSKRKPKDLTVIEYEDTIVGKNGEIVPRHWTLIPSLRHGFGSPALTSLIFELFQIWKEQGFSSPKIQFGSIYNLVKRTGLKPTDNRAYERIRTDLEVLVEISVVAKNAFWDNEKGAYVSRTFHLFEHVDFYQRTPNGTAQAILPFSYIKASETMWHSVESNALITLRGINRELFHSLTPTEQKLALYLGKVLYKKNEYRRDVETLSRQIPIYTSTYKDTKKILSRRCDGLIKKQFPYLTSYHYEPTARKGRDNIVFTRTPSFQTAEPNTDEQEEARAKQAYLVEEILNVTRDEHSRNFYTNQWC
jgi:hypothetical protein